MVAAEGQPVIVVGAVVRVGDRYGTVVDTKRTNGVRMWQVQWENGNRTWMFDDEVIEVEREEWQIALQGMPSDRRCPSVGGFAGGRRCAMAAGHYTPYHREAEVSWTE